MAYRTQRLGLLYPSMMVHRLLRRAVGEQPTPRGIALKFLKRAHELIERDWENAARGVYPRDLLFQYPFRTHLQRLPSWMHEVALSYRRMQAGDFRDLPPDEDLTAYPPYYRRTFHWQTDGYLSRRSARLYDLGVEFLFLGLADVMRRQVLAPIYDHLRATNRMTGAMLDVGCGTARTLLQARAAFPTLKLTGIDLSPYYLDEARSLLDDDEGATFIPANGEEMPFDDGVFDVVSCVHLFHELPRAARRNVFGEMHRVLRPHGLLVIMDSAQYSDSPEIGHALEKFSADFHEPFHADYVHDDLASLAEGAGFRVKDVSACFAAKLLVAERRT
jgi:ubiquinone/menaquinone biosynthesis C-methylase UbiE